MMGMSFSYSITLSLSTQVMKRRVRLARYFLSLTRLVRDVLRQSLAMPQGATAEVVAHPANSKQAKAKCDHRGK